MFNHALPLQWGWIDSIVTKGICDIYLNVSPLEKVELGLFFFFLSWGENPHWFWELPKYISILTWRICDQGPPKQKTWPPHLPHHPFWSRCVRIYLFIYYTSNTRVSSPWVSHWTCVRPSPRIGVHHPFPSLPIKGSLVPKYANIFYETVPPVCWGRLLFLLFLSKVHFSINIAKIFFFKFQIAFISNFYFMTDSISSTRKSMFAIKILTFFSEGY